MDVHFRFKVLLFPLLFKVYNNNFIHSYNIDPVFVLLGLLVL